MLWYTLPFLELVKVKSPEEYLIADSLLLHHAPTESLCWLQTHLSSPGRITGENYIPTLYVAQPYPFLARREQIDSI